jgi:hypothetical protein
MMESAIDIICTHAVLRGSLAVMKAWQVGKQVEK